MSLGFIIEKATQNFKIKLICFLYKKKFLLLIIKINILLIQI